MKLRKGCIPAIALLLAPVTVLAAALPTTDMDRYADTVTDLFDKANKMTTPYYAECAAAKDAELFKTTLKMAVDIIDQTGSAGYEGVQREPYGESLVFIQCITKTENVFYPVASTFYKLLKDWVLNDLQFGNSNTLYSASGH